MADIKHALDCQADIVHISVPVSQLQMQAKLKRDQQWVLDTMCKCIDFARKGSGTVTLGLEDASRADPEFLLRVVATAAKEGVVRVRYADTVGISQRQKILTDIKMLKQHSSVPIEFHAHNDLGMAVSNSLAAVEAGAEFIDCTVGGIGERAGNCNLLNFIHAGQQFLDLFGEVNEHKLAATQETVLNILMP